MVRAILAALLMLIGGAAEAAYPERPIHIVVPITPGGGPDIAARILGEELTARLGQQVVVENRPGSNGNIAGELVARAPADGYTLLLAQDTLLTVNPTLYRTRFDPLHDLAPVASVGAHQFILTVNAALPAPTLEAFIALARRSDPPLFYASGGNGSAHHLAVEMLKAAAGIDLVHVPFRGGGEATAATVAGETAAMFAGTSSAGQLRAGRLRAIAVGGAERSGDFPDLPRVAELYPGFEARIWVGLFGPVGLPAPVLAILRGEINAALARKDVAHRLAAAGGPEPLVTTPEEFASLIERDRKKYDALVRRLGLTAE